MRHARLDEMVKGWFVGDFAPTVLRTGSCEVAVKSYPAGAREEAHFHKVATEVTLVLSGEVEMCGKVWSKGDILVLDPGDVTGFAARSDAVTVVVKIPGAKDDKFLAASPQPAEAARAESGGAAGTGRTE